MCLKYFNNTLDTKMFTLFYITTYSKQVSTLFRHAKQQEAPFQKLRMCLCKPYYNANIV